MWLILLFFQERKLLHFLPAISTKCTLCPSSKLFTSLLPGRSGIGSDQSLSLTFPPSLSLGDLLQIVGVVHGDMLVLFEEDQLMLILLVCGNEASCHIPNMLLQKYHYFPSKWFVCSTK